MNIKCICNAYALQIRCMHMSIYIYIYIYIYICHLRHTYIYIYIYIYNISVCVCACQPFRVRRYDTKSIFKGNLAGLNSEFSFSEICWHTKFKQPSLHYYLHLTGERKVEITSAIRNANRFPQDWNSHHRVHFQRR